MLPKSHILEMMGMVVNIPDSVVEGLRLPRKEAEQRLRTELALALYQQQMLSLGKASELAGLSRSAFGDLLALRDIPRHYSEEDLAQDISYARGE